MTNIQITENKIRQFYTTLSRPIKYCSLFYTYYYLCEIKKHNELRPYFNELINDLYESFFNYGIYSVIRELTHLNSRFRCESIESYIEEANIKPDKQTLNIMKLYKETNRLHIDKDYATVKDMCIEAEIELNAFSKPIRFLHSAEHIFILPDVGSYCGWDSDYGGYLWGNISKLLYSMNATTTITFIDSCWNLQHNSGTWLNKLSYGEDDYIITEIAMDQDYTYIDKLQMLLGENYDGNLRKIYKIAVIYNQFLVDYKGDIHG